jgi:hypothetical protein
MVVLTSSAGKVVRSDPRRRWNTASTFEALRSEEVGQPVGKEVALPPIPSPNEYVEVVAILVPTGPTRGLPPRARLGRQPCLMKVAFRRPPGLGCLRCQAGQEKRDDNSCRAQLGRARKLLY